MTRRSTADTHLDQGFADQGFTLLEMIAVLAILALAAGLAMPRLSAMRQNLKVKSAAVQLVSSLKITRAAALASNDDHALIVDTQRRRYWADGAVRTQALPRDLSVAFEGQGGGPDSAGRASFLFRPDGTASGGKINIGSGRQGAVITVDWLTGSIALRWQ